MRKWIGLCALLFAVSLVMAQPCVPSFPEVISVGTSHCIQVCPNSLIVIEFDGTLIGPEAVPVIIMEAGCQTNYCNTECTPLVPPVELILGGDPFFPEDYYGQSDCLEIYLRWVHTDVWAFEIFSVCEGCFCVTFDRQLSVEVSAFEAMPGDGSVELRWTTASETGNDHFEIRRDGEIVSQVASAGNTSTGNHYTWVDQNLENGRTYAYTLVAVDVANNREEVGTDEATPKVSAGVVTEYALHQNYPNPFNPSTSISFDLLENGNVTLKVYNMIGQEVAELVNSNLHSGHHTVSFDASRLPSGLYIYRLETAGFTDQKKMLLLK